MAFSTHDQVPDSPTNTFATFNVLTEPNVTTGHTFSDGNLKLAFSTTAGVFPSLLGSIAIPNDTGVWYWEVYYTTTTFNSGFGIYNENTGLTTDYGGSQANLTDAGFVLFNGSSLRKVYLNTITEIANSLSSPIILQLIFDAENRKLFIKYNDTEPSGQNISSGTSLFPVFSAGKTYIPAYYHGDGGSGTKSGTFIINHGQDHTFGGYPNSLASSSGYADANGIGSFYYQPPTGGLALCTANLSDPDIDPAVDDLPADYFKAVTYTGQTVGGAMTSWNGTTGTVECGFQPDLVWGKNRDFGNYHEWTDSVRGATHSIFSNEPNAEETNAEKLKSFDSNGFSIGNAQGYNKSGDKHVAWCWKAGGAPTADNSNTSGAMAANSVSVDGTLQSSYTPSGSPTIYPKRMSVNTKAGFSIVKYVGNGNSGATIPHGLNSAPEFFIIKNIDSAITGPAWPVWHESFGANDYLDLYTTVQKLNASTMFPSVPNSQTITLGTAASHNTTDNYICYAWHSVAGYSAFGSYTGNGDVDGPFVYTGFKPAWVMVKNISTSGSGTSFSNWSIFDSARPPYNTNPANNRLEADTALAEDGDGKTGSGGNGIDMLSNGFKLRAGDWYETNHSSSTYIYAAFAEQPFKYANAR